MSKNKIKHILENFSLSDYDVKTGFQDIIDYYDKNKRHNYHEITEYVASFNNSDQETISVICHNLSRLIGELNIDSQVCNKRRHLLECDKFNCDESVKIDTGIAAGLFCYEYKSHKKNINKLYDHIKMEQRRFLQLKEMSDKLLRETKETYKEALSKTEDLNTQIGRLQKETAKLKKNTIEMKKNTEGIYVQIVSVLGIFSAVMMAVFGGMNLFNSAYSLTGKSVWEVLFTVSSGFFVLYNLLFLMLAFIAHIYLEKKPPDYIWNHWSWINLALIMGVVLSLIGVMA